VVYEQEPASEAQESGALASGCSLLVGRARQGGVSLDEECYLQHLAVIHVLLGKVMPFTVTLITLIQ